MSNTAEAIATDGINSVSLAKTDSIRVNIPSFDQYSDANVFTTVDDNGRVSFDFPKFYSTAFSSRAETCRHFTIIAESMQASDGGISRYDGRGVSPIISDQGGGDGVSVGRAIIVGDQFGGKLTANGTRGYSQTAYINKTTGDLGRNSRLNDNHVRNSVREGDTIGIAYMAGDRSYISVVAVVDRIGPYGVVINRRGESKQLMVLNLRVVGVRRGLTNGEDEVGAFPDAGQVNVEPMLLELSKALLEPRDKPIWSLVAKAMSPEHTDYKSELHQFEHLVKKEAHFVAAKGVDDFVSVIRDVAADARYKTISSIVDGSGLTNVEARKDLLNANKRPKVLGAIYHVATSNGLYILATSPGTEESQFPFIVVLDVDATIEDDFPASIFFDKALTAEAPSPHALWDKLHTDGVDGGPEWLASFGITDVTKILMTPVAYVG